MKWNKVGGVMPEWILLVEPARRHRCEVCRDIFECHLCGILKTHPAHRLDGGLAKTMGYVFVCSKCCLKTGERYQLRKRDVMDMLTGKQVV